MEKPIMEDEEATREFNFNRQKNTAKSMLETGDAYFISGKLIKASSSFASTAEHIKTCDARTETEKRWKRIALAEIKRRIDMVMGLLPKEKQHDVMEAMQLRRQKEAEEAGGAVDGSEDPEQIIQASRRKLRHTCERIRRQLAMTQEMRSPHSKHSQSLASISSAASMGVNESLISEVEAIPPLTKVGSMVKELEEDMQTRHLKRKVAENVYKFDGVRGVYLDIPEVSQEPVSPMNVQDLPSVLPHPPSVPKIATIPLQQDIKPSHKSSFKNEDVTRQDAAERLACLVGDRHVPYEPLKHRPQPATTTQEIKDDPINRCKYMENEHIQDNKNVGMFFKSEEKKRENVEHGSISKIKEVDKLGNQFDCLEKALLAESRRKDFEVPRSHDDYVIPALETMQLEQTFIDTRRPVVMQRAPVVGRHLRLSLGLRGNSSVQLR